MFPHPTYYRHEVVCSNLDFARQWMLEYVESGKKKKKASVQPEKAAAESEPRPEAETANPTATRQKPIATVFQNGNRKSVAILLDRRKMREKLNFFATLTEVIFGGRRSVPQCVHKIHFYYSNMK